MSDAAAATAAAAESGNAAPPPEIDASVPTTPEEIEQAKLWKELEAEDAAASSDDPPAAADAAAEEDREDEAAATEIETEQSEAPTGEAPPVEKGEEEVKAPVAAADPFANATPEQRAAWEAAQARLETLEHADKSNRGRLSTAMRELEKLRQRREETPQKAAPAAGSAQDFRETDKWKSFVAEYPDVAGPIGDILFAQGATIADQKKVTDAYKANEAKRLNDLLEANVAAVEKDVPDWLSVTGNPDEPNDAAKLQAFRDWVEDQPKKVREAAYRNADEIVNPKEAASVLAAYKDFRSTQSGANNAGQEPRTPANAVGAEPTGSLSSKRALQLESSRGSRSTAPGPANGIAEDGDPQVLWDQFEEMDRRKARRA
jgi:hypothetical protein